MTAREQAEYIAKVLSGKKAQEVRALKVEDLTAIADYFVLATGGSNTQVRALVDEVEFKMKEKGIAPLRIEGYETRNWVLLDYNTVIVHVFYPEARNFYALESLWADATPLELDLDEEN